MNQKEIELMIKRLYWEREPNGIKSDYGRSWIIGSSRLFPNATAIAALLCSKAGNGYTAISVPEEVYQIVATRVPMTDIFECLETKNDDFVDENISNQLKKYNSILIGNGMKVSKANYDFMTNIIREYEGNLIIDASALTMLSEYGIDVLKQHKTNCRILLTPHLGEANKLFKTDIKSRDPEDYLEIALSFSKTYDVSILLKSYKSILIADNSYQRMDVGSTPSLGKAGSGDGLSGYLCGLLSYGEKYFSYSQLIEFGDWMIHCAAKKVEDEKSSGFSSILDVVDGIKEIISQYK